MYPLYDKHRLYLPNPIATRLAVPANSRLNGRSGLSPLAIRPPLLSLSAVWTPLARVAISLSELRTIWPMADGRRWHTRAAGAA